MPLIILHQRKQQPEGPKGARSSLEPCKVQEQGSGRRVAHASAGYRAQGRSRYKAQGRSHKSKV